MSTATQRRGTAAAAPSRDADDAAAKSRRSRPSAARNVLLGLLALALAGSAAFAYWLSPALLKAWRGTRAPDYASEKTFDDGAGALLPFPSIFDADATRFLSVIVPAYNEEERMKEGIDEMVAFLQAKEAADGAFTWEIIIVDDGSRDATATIAVRDYVRPLGGDRVRLLKAFANGGKGAAVRKGVMRARGRFVLMADADGATRFSDLDALLADGSRVSRGSGDGDFFAVGSRAHLFRGGKGKRSALRRVLSWGFHKVVGALLGGSDIEDTQCGFKLWSRASARTLFSALHIERWAFDVELVYLAARKGVPMVEVPVEWKEVAGSKLDPTTASINMARDIIVIRIAYLLGWWKL